MANVLAKASAGLGKSLNPELAKRWRSAHDQISKFLRGVGLTGQEHNQAPEAHGKH